MTKEEAISNLKAYLNGDTAIGNIIPLRSVLESAIRYLETSLPSNLDEAVERMASDIAPDHPDISWDTCYEKIEEGIKAGVEWMAGQFQKIEGRLLDWYETNGVDYCNGISTNESFEVPE